MSAINYSENERKAIESLMVACPTYFTREVAAILVLMYAREFCMARQSLIVFLSNYPYLDNRQYVSDGLDILLDKDYLIKERNSISDFYKIKVNSNIIQMIETSYRDVADLLKSSREKLECVRTFGKTNSNNNASLFYQRMQEAQNEICIVYIATEPYASTVSVLKSILTNSNIKIKLLIANNEICKKLRGVDSPAQKWYDELKEFNNFEIRIYSSMEATEIATSTLVDKNILRMTVFDTMKQRTADGEMLEITNTMGYEMNLIHMHYEKFNRLWDEAEIYKENKVIRFIKKPIFRDVGVCIVCFVFYLIIPNNRVSELLIPIIFGFFLEKVMEITQPRIKELIKR